MKAITIYSLVLEAMITYNCGLLNLTNFYCYNLKCVQIIYLQCYK